MYAGLGGAGHVTTVDVAFPAIEAANSNWKLNGLEASKHDGRAEDAFVFLEAAIKGRCEKGPSSRNVGAELLSSD